MTIQNTATSEPAARGSRQWQKMLLVGLLLATGGVIYVRSDIHRHNRFLSALQTSLRAIPLPEGARRVQSIDKLGLLEGNGNHCDYVVAELCEVRADRSVVERHYSGMTIPNPEGESPFNIQLGFCDIPLDIGGGVVCSPGETDQLRYVIYVTLIGHHDPGLDPRCH